MRRHRAQKRERKPDPKYGNPIVGHFINIIMVDGKKSKAQSIIYSALDMVSEKLKKDPVKALFTALDNTRPHMAVKPRRVGGATYQVPMEVPKEKGIFVALGWIKGFARKKKNQPMQKKLADEIIAAYNNEGPAVKKKEDTHKMAESNKAFAHFKY